MLLVGVENPYDGDIGAGIRIILGEGMLSSEFELNGLAAACGAS